jgi:type IV pilus assembly protein PilP
MTKPLTLILVTLVLTIGCGEDDVVTNKPPAASDTGSAAQGGSRKAPAAEEKKPDEEAPPKIEFQEEDFVETPRSRDPFRSFEDLFTEKPAETAYARPSVILEDYSLDDLKLIAVITRISPAKAMLVDPTGVGYVVHRNDLVGRAERVQSGAGSAEYEINWRVDRIRDSDVVFVREDPSNPDIPSATRVVSMHPEEEKP